MCAYKQFANGNIPQLLPYFLDVVAKATIPFIKSKATKQKKKRKVVTKQKSP